MPPHDRAVTLTPHAPGWVIALPSRGIVEHRSTLAGAIRKAEAIAAEYHAAITVDLVEWSNGGFGPRHLIGSPCLFVAQEDDESWSVAMLGRPAQFPNPNQAFVGPNAERAAMRWADKALAMVRTWSEAVADRKERHRALANKERRELQAERREVRP